MRCTPAEKMIPRRAARRPSGLTLMELVVSMVATSALLVGMSSAVFLASRAAQPGLAASSVIEASLTAGQIATELGSATSVIERTLTSIAFTVADRDRDGQPETIRYEWSGVSGEPLTRQYNGGTTAAVLENVNVFGLTYHTQTIQVEPDGPVEQESDEHILIGYDDVGTLSTNPVKTDFWPGEFFTPILLADTVHWRVTRVQIVMRKGTEGQPLHIQLRSTAAGNVPSSTFLEEVVVDSSNLNESYAWHTFPFNNVSGLRPDQTLCLVLTAEDANAIARVHCLSTPLALGVINMVTSDNRGDSWTTISNTNLRFIIWGTETALVDVPYIEKFYLNRVSMGLQVGSNRNSVVYTAVHMHNAPKVAGP